MWDHIIRLEPSYEEWVRRIEAAERRRMLPSELAAAALLD